MSPSIGRAQPIAAVAIVLGLLVACWPQREPIPIEPTTPASDLPARPKAALGKEPTAQEEGTRAQHAEPPKPAGQAFVRAPLSLRRAPESDRWLRPAQGKPRIANLLSVLQRGERLHVLASEGAYLSVELSDGQRGYVERSGVQIGESLGLATNLLELPTFARPDVLTVKRGQKVAPGSLLLILREKDVFAEADLGPAGTAWVLGDALERAEAEVEAAKVLARALALEAHNDGTDEPLWALLRARYGATQIVRQLAPRAAARGDGQGDDAAGLPAEGGHLSEAAADVTTGEALGPAEQGNAWAAPRATEPP